MAGMRVMTNPSQTAEQMSLLERRRPKVLAALRELLGDHEWHSMAELEAVAGRRYGARLFELRRGEDGRPPSVIEVRTEGGGCYEYRQTGVGR
jgi:hypothetical protein